VHTAKYGTNTVLEVAVANPFDKGLLSIRVDEVHQDLKAVDFGLDKLVRKVSRVKHLIKGNHTRLQRLQEPKANRLIVHKLCYKNKACNSFDNRLITRPKLWHLSMQSFDSEQTSQEVRNNCLQFLPSKHLNKARRCIQRFFVDKDCPGRKELSMH
jgi:hypothetical protein